MQAKNSLLVLRRLLENLFLFTVTLSLWDLCPRTLHKICLHCCLTVCRRVCEAPSRGEAGEHAGEEFGLWGLWGRTDGDHTTDLPLISCDLMQTDTLSAPQCFHM